MSTEDTRRWWVVSGDGMVNHYYQAPTGRRARADFRADLIEGFRCGDFTKADAIVKVRMLDLVVVEGPLTSEEACAHETGWTWAETICDDSHGLVIIPTRAVSRDEAVRELGEERATEVEKRVRRRYYPKAVAAASGR